MSIVALLYGGNLGLASKLETILRSSGLDKLVAASVANHMFDKAEGGEINLKDVVDSLTSGTARTLTADPNRIALRDRLTAAGVSPKTASIVAIMVTDEHLMQRTSKPQNGPIRSRFSQATAPSADMVGNLASAIDAMQAEIIARGRDRIYRAMMARGYNSDIAQQVSEAVPARILQADFGSDRFVHEMDAMMKAHPRVPIANLVETVAISHEMNDSPALAMAIAERYTPAPTAFERPSDEALLAAIRGDQSDVSFYDDKRAPNPQFPR